MVVPFGRQSQEDVCEVWASQGYYCRVKKVVSKEEGKEKWNILRTLGWRTREGVESLGKESRTDKSQGRTGD